MIASAPRDNVHRGSVIVWSKGDVYEGSEALSLDGEEVQFVP